MKPLEGIFVLDFGQVLSAASASLRLADLGATVLKVEKPDGGDISRRIFSANVSVGGESTQYQAINRNKQGVCLDLKRPEQREKLVPLLKKADVIIQNYRPGVAERLGLGFEQVREINPNIVFGEISGYGPMRSWDKKPGQDLLAQAVSGLCWLNGSADQPPVPMGISVVDMFAGQQLVQGVLAALAAGPRPGGTHVAVSLLESALDIQFEVLTTYLNDDRRLPKRSAVNGANVYTNAPYGIYETKDGYLAQAMVNVPYLGELIGCEALTAYRDERDYSDKRDEIKAILRDHLKTQTTQYWLDRLEPHDVWCAKALNWKELMEQEGFRRLEMLQKIRLRDGTVMQTTRCPLTIDGERYTSERPAPTLGEHNAQYLQQS